MSGLNPYHLKRLYCYNLIHCICLQIGVPSGYENNEPPTIYCETDIYHPNIDTTEDESESCGTNVCLNLLDKGTWNHKFGFEGAIIGLLYLLNNPNLEDPLSPEFDGVISEDDFEENVALYMRGEEVEGRSYEAEFLKELREKTNSDASDKIILTTECSDSDAQKGHAESGEGKTMIHRNTSDCKDTEQTPKELNEATPIGACVDSGSCGNQTTTDDEQQASSDKEAANFKETTWDKAQLLQEKCLSQFELKFGVEGNKIEEIDRCTLVTVGDDIMLMSNVTDDTLNEADSDVNKEDNLDICENGNDQVSDEHNTPVNVNNEVACDDQDDDSFTAMQSVVDDLFENALNLCSGHENTQSCTVINASEDAHNEAGYSATPILEQISDTKIDACAHGSDDMNVVCEEPMLRKTNYTRQKSREYIRNRGRIFLTCVPYFKSVLYHTFNCLRNL